VYNVYPNTYEWSETHQHLVRLDTQYYKVELRLKEIDMATSYFRSKV
jgi:hypothetical protein